MRIATWNVNSVRARLAPITDWIRTAQPDIILFQEIKCETADFPSLPFESLGYRALVAGQKAYNGVAILSRFDISAPVTTLAGSDLPPESRYVEAQIAGMTIASVYVPNGNPVDSPKFSAKLAFFKHLGARMQTLLRGEVPVIIGGDFNVIPRAADVYDPRGWDQDALYRPETRAAFRRLLTPGYTDAFRALHPHAKKAYSFWDYQAGAWPKNQGLRIDHFLLSAEAIDRTVQCFIDPTPRGGESPSDHTPVVLDLQQGAIHSQTQG